MGEAADPVPAARDDPDLLLLRALAGGDTQALTTLYERHGPYLLAYLTGLLGQRPLAEEVLQDVMLAAWQGAGRFRGEAPVRVWLLGIARRRAWAARRRWHPPALSLDVADLPADPAAPDPADQAATQAALRQALDQLPAEQRETLELIFYHQLTGAEAAAVLRVAPGTVKSRLFRAKAALRRLLRQEEDADA